MGWVNLAIALETCLKNGDWGSDSFVDTCKVKGEIVPALN
jgi:hypothetical protein